MQKWTAVQEKREWSLLAASGPFKMLHYTAVSERTLMKAPLFSSSLDDMKAVSQFYTSPLLPLWPRPPACPPALWRAAPCLPSDNRRRRFVRMTALADAPTEPVRLAASASPIDQRIKRHMFFTPCITSGGRSSVVWRQVPPSASRHRARCCLWEWCRNKMI